MSAPARGRGWRQVVLLLLAGMVSAGPAAAGAAQTPTAADAATRSRLAQVRSVPLQGPPTGHLATALAAAQGAVRRAAAGTAAEASLATQQQVAADVRAAIDPAPGAGLGVRPAVQAVVQVLTAVAQADRQADAQRALPPALAAAANVLRWCDELVAVAQAVGTARDAAAARPLVAQLGRLARDLINGRDLNGDGQVTAPDEGGLLLVELRVGLLALGRATQAARPGVGAGR